MEPTNNVETMEFTGEVTADVSLSFQKAANKDVSLNLSRDGKYIKYNIFGTVFEITAKYLPPIKPVGRGAYGFVCSVMNSETNKKVAIKKIKDVFENNMKAKRTLREIKILRHLSDHENIVGIKDIILPSKRHSFEDVYIAYELMDTDLHRLLRSNHPLSEEHYQFFLYQILRGLKYIHSANVIHRDLKPSNLLLTLQCDLKICDFGLARAESHFMTEYVVTRWYRAPELILNSSVYSSAIDVWSVGCIFMEIVNRKPLFPGNGIAHQLRLIMELLGTPTEEDLGALNDAAKQFLRQVSPLPRQSFSEKFPNVSPLAIDLMEKMLKFDPRQRISVEEALAHPYLSSMHDSGDEPVCAVPFNSDLEEHPLIVEEIRELIYREALAFDIEKGHCLSPDNNS